MHGMAFDLYYRFLLALGIFALLTFGCALKSGGFSAQKESHSIRIAIACITWETPMAGHFRFVTGFSLPFAAMVA